MTPARPRTQGPHFFCDPTDIDGSSAILRGDEARHLTAVLRARTGDPVSLADGRGVMYQARVRAPGREAVLDVLSHFEQPPPEPKLTVVHALPKARKLDEVVRRLTELGVDAIIPVHSQRSQVRLDGDRAAKAVSRWRGVGLAAAKQSRRSRLPQIRDIGEWHTVLASEPGALILWEHATQGIVSALQARHETGGDVTLAIGPEGGLAADEVAGLPCASLGATILRTETASIAAAAIALAHLGRIG
ncbi:MAG TPA: RsmE family RNA methyltransferase [Egibacteraceae bacterium]|nr:RsmE family RNA methyltransferase [Egibacteraceae bacterium]